MDQTVTVTVSKREAEIIASVLRERNGYTLNRLADMFAPTDPCPHTGLFATGAPPESAGREEYARWLDSTKFCAACGTNVKVRDL